MKNLKKRNSCSLRIATPLPPPPHLQNNFSNGHSLRKKGQAAQYNGKTYRQKPLTTRSIYHEQDATVFSVSKSVFFPLQHHAAAHQYTFSSQYSHAFTIIPKYLHTTKFMFGSLIVRENPSMLLFHPKLKKIMQKKFSIYQINDVTELLNTPAQSVQLVLLIVGPVFAQLDNYKRTQTPLDHFST